MNFRVFLIVCLSSLPITVAAQSPAFTLQGNTIHDYQPSLEQATKRAEPVLVGRFARKETTGKRNHGLGSRS